MMPRYPIYIPSKGRYASRLTMKALDRLGLPYHVIVEEQEWAQYAAVIPKARLLVLDPSYQRNFEPCDDWGTTRVLGPGPVRNFAWDHAVAGGHAWHWTMDDNITCFYRLNRQRIHKVTDGTIFRCMEDFCQRYLNIAQAGPCYEMFAPRRSKLPPYVLNTRIYSCQLTRSDVPFRWRCRYNDDTDLCLRMLKAGWCTVQFNAFLQKKMGTQRVKGGLTELYKGEGTLVKSQMLVRLHPDVAKISWRFNRWHHYVDYKGFQKSNRLIRRPDAAVPAGVNEYGMQLVAAGNR